MKTRNHRFDALSAADAAEIQAIASWAMTGASRHYLGESGSSYHEHFKGLHGLNAEFALRTLRLHLDAEASVLDFGCADGALLDALPNEAKLGVEVNPASRARAIERGLIVHESTGEIESGSIDLVVSSRVLEHTLRPLDELTGLGRVLSTNGKLVLILPLDDWRTQRDWILPDRNHHLYAWNNPQLLANLLSEAGFDVRSVEIVTYALPGRFSERLHGALPSRLFNAVARATAVLRRRRQLVAVAIARTH